MFNSHNNIPINYYSAIKLAHLLLLAQKRPHIIVVTIILDKLIEKLSPRGFGGVGCGSWRSALFRQIFKFVFYCSGVWNSTCKWVSGIFSRAFGQIKLIIDCTHAILSPNGVSCSDGSSWLLLHGVQKKIVNHPPRLFRRNNWTTKHTRHRRRQQKCTAKSKKITDHYYSMQINCM